MAGPGPGLLKLDSSFQLMKGGVRDDDASMLHTRYQ